MHVDLILGFKHEECFVTYVGEVENGFLSKDAHLFGVFEVLVEGAAKNVGYCGGGDEEVTGVVGAREHFVAGWWATKWCTRGLEVVCVFSVCPV